MDGQHSSLRNRTILASIVGGILSLSLLIVWSPWQPTYSVEFMPVDESPPGITPTAVTEADVSSWPQAARSSFEVAVSSGVPGYASLTRADGDRMYEQIRGLATSQGTDSSYLLFRGRVVALSLLV